MRPSGDAGEGSPAKPGPGARPEDRPATADMAKRRGGAVMRAALDEIISAINQIDQRTQQRAAIFRAD
jgi:hypothetical protein